MANDAFTQQALAKEPRFILRLQNALGKTAWQVLNESPSTSGHTARANYARGVLSNPNGFATTLAPAFVNRPNVISFTTSYDFQQGAVVTASGDADIESQLATDWDNLSGV